MNLNILNAFAVSVTRLGAGLNASNSEDHTDLQPLEYYEFEACPFCRKVREAMSELNLNAMVYPCPKGGQRYRESLEQLAGKQQFPYLIDPNTGWKGYESKDIVEYLFETYGNEKQPGVLVKGNLLASINSSLASALRLSKGVNAQPSTLPDQPLELYSFEASPFCRIVREKLCELEIPYLLHNVAKNSPSRNKFIERSGKMMVPYLIDPNTGTEMFESEDIVRYLEQTYAQ